MKFLRFFTQLLLAASLTTLIVSYSLLQLVATGTGMSDTLNKSGIYDMVAAEARKGLGSSPKVPAKYQELFATSLNKAIDAAQIEAMLKPAIVDIAAWLNQPDDTPPPDVVIVIKPAKDALIKELSDGGLSGLELTALQMQLSQQVPDQLRLSSLGDLLGESDSGDASGANSNTAKPQTTTSQSDAVVEGLKNLKSGVSALRLAFMISIGATALFSLLVILMSRKLGRSAFKAVSMSYLSEGGLWLALGLIVPAVFHPATDAVTESTIAMHLAPVFIARVLSASLLPAGIIVLIGAIGLAITLLRRPKTPAATAPVQPLAAPPRR